MKRSTSRTLISGTAVLVATISLTAAAWSPFHGGGRGADPERRLERLSSQLELTQEQQAQAEQLFGESTEQARADRERMQELRTILKEQRDDFDAGAAQAAADEIGTITSRMAYRRASTQASFFQLLDEEQQAQMEQIAQKRSKRRAHMREHKRMGRW